MQTLKEYIAKLETRVQELYKEVNDPAGYGSIAAEVEDYTNYETLSQVVKTLKKITSIE